MELLSAASTLTLKPPVTFPPPVPWPALPRSESPTSNLPDPSALRSARPATPQSICAPVHCEPVTNGATISLCKTCYYQHGFWLNIQLRQLDDAEKKLRRAEENESERVSRLEGRLSDLQGRLSDLQGSLSDLRGEKLAVDLRLISLEAELREAISRASAESQARLRAEQELRDAKREAQAGERSARTTAPAETIALPARLLREMKKMNVFKFFKTALHPDKYSNATAEVQQEVEELLKRVSSLVD